MTKDNATNKMELAGKPALPSLEVDWELYGHFLDSSDLSDDQKREFVETLWSIVLSFVDLGFDIKSPQETCGKTIDLRAALEAAVLKSDGANAKKKPANEGIKI